MTVDYPDETAPVEIPKARKACPSCGSVNILRIKRSPFLKYVLFWADAKKYKCLKCNRHMLLWN